MDEERDRRVDFLVQDNLRLKNELRAMEARCKQLGYQIKCYQTERATLTKICNEQGVKIRELEVCIADLEMAMRASTERGIEMTVIDDEEGD